MFKALQLTVNILWTPGIVIVGAADAFFNHIKRSIRELKE